MAECIVPTVFIHRAVLNRANGVFPLIARVHVCSLYDTASGETEHTRLEAGKFLHEVFSQSVLTTLPCVCGEKGKVLKVNSCFRLAQKYAQFTL